MDEDEMAVAEASAVASRCAVEANAVLINTELARNALLEVSETTRGGKYHAASKAAHSALYYVGQAMAAASEARFWGEKAMSGDE